MGRVGELLKRANNRVADIAEFLYRQLLNLETFFSDPHQDPISSMKHVEEYLVAATMQTFINDNLTLAFLCAVSASGI